MLTLVLAEERCNGAVLPKWNHDLPPRWTISGPDARGQVQDEWITCWMEALDACIAWEARFQIQLQAWTGLSNQACFSIMDIPAWKFSRKNLLVRVQTGQSVLWTQLGSFQGRRPQKRLMI